MFSYVSGKSLVMLEDMCKSSNEGGGPLVALPCRQMPVPPIGGLVLNHLKICRRCLKAREEWLFSWGVHASTSGLCSEICWCLLTVAQFFSELCWKKDGICLMNFHLEAFYCEMAIPSHIVRPVNSHAMAWYLREARNSGVRSSMFDIHQMHRKGQTADMEQKQQDVL